MSFPKTIYKPDMKKVNRTAELKKLPTTSSTEIKYWSTIKKGSELTDKDNFNIVVFMFVFSHFSLDSES